MKLCAKENCSGCLACYNACNLDAIILTQDKEGFTYPSINPDKCKDCGLCTQACPVLNFKDHERLDDIEAYAAWNKDYRVVRRSSSGGFFTTISHWFLANSGSIYGAAFDKDFNVRHIRVTDEEGLLKLVGSKYVQSNIGTTFKQAKNDLKNGMWVLYSGTPCQIAGLNNYLGEKVDRLKLITIDLVCHGVPTPLMFHEYKNYLEKKYNSKFKSYSFRDKKWSWSHYNTKAVFENGAVYYGKWEEDIFMRGFLREYFLRPSCHQCQYANTHRPGDFSIADFWGYSNPKGEERNRDRGVSAILVNTIKAQCIYNEVVNSLHSYKKTLAEPVRTNRALRECFPESSVRDKYWIDYSTEGFSDSFVEHYLYPEKINRDTQVLYKYGKNLHYLISKVFIIIKKIRISK